MKFDDYKHIVKRLKFTRGETFLIESLHNTLTAIEREECAELCEEMALALFDKDKVALQLAAENIRARGN